MSTDGRKVINFKKPEDMPKSDTKDLDYQGVETFDLDALKDINGKKYTKEEIINVGMTYVVTGTDVQCAKLTGVPRDTIKSWRTKSSWWPELIRQCKISKQKELDAKMSEVIHEAVEGIKDRLLHGDYVLDKNGELVRRPCSAKELSVITGVFFDKRALIRGDVTSHSLKSSSTDSMLKKIEERMVSLAKKTEKAGLKEKGEVTSISKTV